MNIEQFYYDSELSLQETEEKKTKLAGYAMKFNTLSHDRGGYRDVFRHGVFGDTINGSEGFDVKAYFDHSPESYLGRTSNGSLKLALDATGLKFELDVPPTSLGADILALVERGDLSGCSFGYVPDQFRWKDEGEGNGAIREHTAGRLIEISVVFDPAFPKTELALASLEQWKLEQKELASTIRRDEAKRLLQLNGIRFNA